VFCTRCGQSNAEDARFCSRCGAHLVRPGDPVAALPEDVGVSDATSTLMLGAITAAAEAPAEARARGAEESALSPADDAVLEALPAGSALLVVTHGPNAGSRFLLDQDITTAGRHPDSDIFLDDVTVSRRHAEFARSGDGGFRVRDVGSLNGTYVGRERIDDVELGSGAEVQIGKFRLVFHAARTPAAPA